MSAIDILLDQFFAGSDPPFRRASAGEPIVLAAGDDVIVNITENETASLIHFYSSPGYCPPGSPPDVPLPEAAQDVLEGTVSEGYRHEESGLFMLLRTMRRERMDSVGFRHELDCHIAQCRAWAAVLPPTPPLEEPVRRPSAA